MEIQLSRREDCDPINYQEERIVIPLIDLTLPQFCVYPWISKVIGYSPSVYVQWGEVDIHGMVDQPVLFKFCFPN
jgi:hypothetical protein